jgi:TIR domain/HEAT repeats
MPWNIFYSYSHRDADLRERLATYLAPLRQQKKIVEWHDRKIEPGGDWQNEISERLNSAHLILLLVSEDFLASEYCFGVEVERALARLKRGEVRVVPVLLKPCLWQESRFSELQIIPRDAKPITSWTSREEAFVSVASEIRTLVSEAPSFPAPDSSKSTEAQAFESSLSLVRGQIQAYARLYERTRQRMRPSSDRTSRMEQILVQMRALATASYPLLAELTESPSPGERLAAVAILQVFATEPYLPFLVRLVGSEKPFVGYQAIVALRFAVGALDAAAHPQLKEALEAARAALERASAGFDSDRQLVLRDAEQELKTTIESLAAPKNSFD